MSDDNALEPFPKKKKHKMDIDPSAKNIEMPNEADDDIKVISPDDNTDNINNESGPRKAAARKTQAFKTRAEYIEENELLKNEIEMLKHQLVELSIRVNTSTPQIINSPTPTTHTSDNYPSSMDGLENDDFIQVI